jgi:hypothetical protein
MFSQRGLPFQKGSKEGENDKRFKLSNSLYIYAE